MQWGPLNVVIEGEVGDNQFVSYRLDLKYGGITSATTDMETLSGLRVMDTVGQMKEIYAGFTIEFVVDADAGLVFELTQPARRRVAAVGAGGVVERRRPGDRHLLPGLLQPRPRHRRVDDLRWGRLGDPDRPLGDLRARPCERRPALWDTPLMTRSPAAP